MMASINVSERDFTVVAQAALDARDNNAADQSQALDKIARKINAALSKSVVPLHPFSHRHILRWQDMPSVFESAATAEQKDG